MGKKWVAANNMIMVRIQNPVSKIKLLNAANEYVPEGTVVSMGHLAVKECGSQLINQVVRFIPQMQREAFGDPNKDEQLFVIIPWEAVVAALDPNKEETDAAASH